MKALDGRWVERSAILLVGLIVTGVYLQAYRLHPAHPHLGFGDGGWWNGFDQQRYYAAAKAWSEGNFDPAQHWYLPGYPLLGAVFMPWLSVHSYAAVDLLCLLASLLLFSRIAIRLLPAWLPMPGLIGAALFGLASMGSPTLREIWVMPWSSSGAAPFTYAAFLASLRCLEAPRRSGRAIWIGVAVGTIAAFRPTDIIPVGVACLVPLLICFVRQPRPMTTVVRTGGAGVLGLGATLALVGAIYLGINGLQQNAYLSTASGIGFEWRLLGLRWVTLGLDPRPLYDQGAGLITAIPWLPLGLATFPLYLILPTPPLRRLASLTMILAVSLHVALYLTFRDLYPEGLFRHENYHYYKWTVPVLLLFCVMLLCDLAVMRGRRLAIVAATVAGLAVLLPWRAQFTEIQPMSRDDTADPRQSIGFRDGLTGLHDAVIVSASGSWDAIYSGVTSLVVGGHRFTERLDYKLHPTMGGFFLVPLRRLPAGPAVLTVDQAITLDPSKPLLHARQSTVFGWPCWPRFVPAACIPQPILEPPALPVSGAIAMDATGDTYRLGDWSQPEPNGRWTAGRDVSFVLPAPKAGEAHFDMHVAAFVPPGTDTLQASLSANGHELAQWRFDNPQPTRMTVPIPPVIAHERPALLITIHIDNPRRPSDTLGSSDQRTLGLFFLGAALKATAP